MECCFGFVITVFLLSIKDCKVFTFSSESLINSNLNLHPSSGSTVEHWDVPHPMAINFDISLIGKAALTYVSSLGIQLLIEGDCNLPENVSFCTE